MKHMTQSIFLSIGASLLLCSCGSTGTNNDTTQTTSTNTPATSNATDNTSAGTTGNGNNSSSNSSSTAAQCDSLGLALEFITVQYLPTEKNYALTSPNYDKGSSDSDSKGSGDGDSKDSDGSGDSGDKDSGDSDSKGSSDSDSKGSGDDGKGSGAGSHNEGKACLQCHSFASGATVFKTLNAADRTPGASGYKIQLNDSVVYSGARGIGNSRLSSYSGGKFTAKVIDPNGNVVNSSASMSHDSGRMDCNRCHTPSGNNGAPGRIVSYAINNSSPSTNTTPSTSTPATTACTGTNGTTAVSVSFSTHVMPILNAKCKSCHGSNGNFTVTSPNATHANITALKGSPTAGGNYLLQKGTNSVGHGGGTVISGSSAEYTTIKGWINAGAPNN